MHFSFCIILPRCSAPLCVSIILFFSSFGVPLVPCSTQVRRALLVFGLFPLGNHSIPTPLVRPAAIFPLQQEPAGAGLAQNSLYMC